MANKYLVHTVFGSIQNHHANLIVQLCWKFSCSGLNSFACIELASASGSPCQNWSLLAKSLGNVIIKRLWSEFTHWAQSTGVLCDYSLATIYEIQSSEQSLDGRKEIKKTNPWNAVWIQALLLVKSSRWLDMLCQPISF